MAEIFKDPGQNGDKRDSGQGATGATASNDPNFTQRALFNSLVDLQKTRGKFNRIEADYAYYVSNGRLRDAKKLLLKYKQLDINNSAAGTTFLHVAVGKVDTAMIMFAASQNADMGIKDNLGQTPYDIVKFLGDESLMKIFEMWGTMQGQGQKIDFAQLERDARLNGRFSSTIRFLADAAKSASAYIRGLPSKTKKNAAKLIVALMIPLSIVYGVNEHRLSPDYIRNSREITDVNNWLNTHSNHWYMRFRDVTYKELFRTKTQRDNFEKNKKLYGNINIFLLWDGTSDVEFKLNGNRYLLEQDYVSSNKMYMKRVFQIYAMGKKALTKSEASKALNTDVGRLAFDTLIRLRQLPAGPVW